MSAPVVDYLTRDAKVAVTVGRHHSSPFLFNPFSAGTVFLRTSDSDV